MKKIILLFTIFVAFGNTTKAQVAGDTIITSAFNYTQTYGSGIRDTMIHFPDQSGLTFEKIYMLYNMRCKNGVSVPSGSTPQSTTGCGEWDYSCNTYIIDSTKTDSTKATGPSHVITGFTGTTYDFTSIPTYTYYKYTQQQVINTAILSETTATIGAGASSSNVVLHTQLQNGKSYYLWTAAELSAAGLVAGNISSCKLDVLTAGSSAQFLKINMKHSTQSSLNASSPDLTGFTEVYFLNTTFINGVNQLNFYNNFNWNGTDNILVEFSFSNSSNGIDNIFSSDNNTSIMGLTTNSNDYSVEFDGSNKVSIGNANFSNFSDQLSISFWANGNANFLPTNSSVLEAVNLLNQRQVNIHFPWTNSNIYWDCGNGTTGTDRINLLATPADFEGSWIHWTFTKNSTSGIMNIYKNGNLWHTGTAKTIPIAVTNMFLGMGANSNNPYFGKVDELSIWNTELTQTTIQNWMNKSITSSHPNYSNLQAYYNFNEGTGSLCNDNSASPSNSTIIGNQLWSQMKGKDFFKNFTETTNRPKIVFVQGTYTQTTTTTTVMDSVLNFMNTVSTYQVLNNNYSLLSTANYYKAGYSYVYDGNSNILIDSIFNTIQGTINITQLNYFNRNPMALQLMSFVTPYGNGLDLGVNGKTWTFDVSDYAPVLKGWKRLTMDAGGQWQEDMDIKFMFIVGTPPRNVKNINNIWKVESTSYTNILNNSKFEARNILLDPTATDYKIRSTITGHGQEGEFIPQTHFLNINNTSPAFSWVVEKICGDNPIYPQGGTWLYDRAGWCPGMATLLKEFPITPLVTPGSIANIDYGIVSASGTSNYWVSNQLVSYGSPNFTLDASITEIKNPSLKIEYARTNPICSNPIITIKNTGTTTLTSLTIEYWVNNNTQRATYQWTGNLAYLESTDVTLQSPGDLWNSLTGATNNVFHVEIKNPNNGIDMYAYNNKMSSAFNITNVVPRNFFINFKTNNVASENKYELLDANNVVLFSRTGMNNNTLYKDSIHLDYGCYKFIITDDGGDGIYFWANSAAGTGYANFKTTAGATIKTFPSDFGNSYEYDFTIDVPLSYEELFNTNEIEIYPNPAKNEFILKGNTINNNSITVYNNIGQELSIPFTKENNSIKFNSSKLTAGLYFIVLKDKEGKTQSMKITIE